MDKFSYAIGLGIGQNLLSMGAQSINVVFDYEHRNPLTNQAGIQVMEKGELP